MPSRQRSRPPNGTTESSASAEAAGLRYVSDTRPGITRRRIGTGFTYIAPDGKRITDKKQLARIRALAIPPAYTDAWICPQSDGHIQATGRDARGRKQYRYHARWREVRDETKFERMLEFSRVLPAIRARVDRDLSRPGLPREKVLATVVLLLERTGIRVGNDEYAKSNRSFGLTTLRNHHVEISGSKLRFQFRGKGGKIHDVAVTDRRLARIVTHCQAVPGETLFEYVDTDGVRQSVDSGDVNEYLREITGQEFTAKDFRTWAGTIHAIEALSELGPAETARDANSAILKAIDQVAERLNNTRAVCRKYYVHPAVFETYQAGTMLEAMGNGNGNGTAAAAAAALSARERAVVRLLTRGAQAGVRPAASSPAAGRNGRRRARDRAAARP